MAIEGFSVEVEDPAAKPGRVVVTVAGDVDLAAADSLWEVLDEHVRPGGELVVDCSRVAFLDSMGLRALIRARHKADEVGARLALTSPSDAVLRVLELAGVAGMFAVDGPSRSG